MSMETTWADKWASLQLWLLWANGLWLYFVSNSVRSVCMYYFLFVSLLSGQEVKCSAHKIQFCNVTRIVGRYFRSDAGWFALVCICCACVLECVCVCVYASVWNGRILFLCGQVAWKAKDAIFNAYVSAIFCSCSFLCFFIFVLLSSLKWK